MNDNSASSREVREPRSAKRIRSPHDISCQPVSEMVECWADARGRTVLARRAYTGDVVADDLFIELAYGARIAREATAGRWCVVAELLRLNALESWAQAGSAMDMNETEAHDGFCEWISCQVYLRQSSITLGISDAEAEVLYSLAEAVIL